ncbi:MAG: MEKHLA domain-containing protein [Steroidobacteraceae bacterium]
MPDTPDVTKHVIRLLASHRELTGRPLLDRLPGETDAEIAQRLYAAPFVVLAHGTEPDPLFNYANLAAQRLFELSWDEFIGLPSRLSAEAPERNARSRLLSRVATHGFIDDYTGVRISKSGHRFRIERATVWNISDGMGHRVGQAARFSEWTPCDDTPRHTARDRYDVP